MKRFIITIVALFAFAFIANAQTPLTKTVNYSAAGTNSAISDTGIVIYKMTITASNAVTKLALFDAPSTALTWTRSAYNSRTGYITNIVSTYIDAYSGRTNLTTNSTWYSYIVTNDQATVSYPSAGVWNIAANATVEITPANPLLINRGLLFTNSAPCDITIDYMPLK